MSEAGQTKGRFTKASVRDAEVSGKRVLVRCDLNVPLDGGTITDDARIRGALPTLELLCERGASIVVCSHLGRPDGHDPDLSLAPVADRLGDLLGVDVALAGAVVGDEVAEQAAQLGEGEVLLLENTRYEEGETANDPDLARDLAALADVYVNDAFGAAHRAHASTAGVADHLPAYAGLLLEREVRELTAVLEDPQKPLVVVLGGAKVSDKIGVIESFLDVADTILIGGAMCFSFFRAQGHETGDSLVEEEGVGLARDLLERTGSDEGCEIMLPIDLSLGREFDAATDVKEFDGVDVPDGWMGLDVGPRTAAAYSKEIEAAGTVFWNGPMGAFELEPFAAATKAVAASVARATGVTVVGGGDSAAALAEFGYADQVSWLSTGGGAALELIEGKELPGVEALEDG